MVGGHLNLGDLIAWDMLQLGLSQGALSLSLKNEVFIVYWVPLIKNNMNRWWLSW